MGFGDLKSESGLKTLNDYLQDRSYIEGYQPSQADSVVFSALSGTPKEEFYHALRWFNQISSYGSEKNSFPGSKKSLTDYGPSGAGAKAAASDDDDNDDDLFGSDSDDDDEAAQKAMEERKKKMEEGKKKAGPIAKSLVIFAVKGWDDETDWVEVEKLVRGIEQDGLKWTASELKPVAFGVKKLVISAVVVDDKVSTDALEETILGFEDYVQSVDIEGFNKL